ncbi:MAG TPA: hypothetical protein VK506_05550 [Conexibacter sp.]|nr:hypothetical protein [Conexibacter sp.]
MTHYLLVYDRDAGELVRKQIYAQRAEAMQARFRAEAEFNGRGEIEIVALDAESERELQRTHGRYFLGLTELADRITAR